jgi:lipocalin
MAPPQEPNIEVIIARYRAAWPELRRLPLELSGNGPLASFIQQKSRRELWLLSKTAYRSLKTKVSTMKSTFSL